MSLKNPYWGNQLVKVILVDTWLEKTVPQAMQYKIPDYMRLAAVVH
jgi:hypothetical protein